jgi:hypothetical protein
MNTKQSDDVPAKGPKYLAALSSLPEHLRPVYQALVEEYKFHALIRYGKAWVAYDVIADLVKAGWRSEPGHTDAPAAGPSVGRREEEARDGRKSR